MSIGMATLALALTTPSTDADLERGRALIEKMIRGHGAQRLAEECVDFEFRGVPFRARRSGGRFRYERREAPNHEILTNDQFRVSEKGAWLTLTPQQASGGRQRVNSVIYFATLPLALRDPGVRPRVLDPQTIKGTTYEVLEVRFAKEGGGDYPNDVYRYWIEPKTGLMAYLAYFSEAGTGRVRFRLMTHRTRVGDVVFTGWDNYGVSDPSIPFGELPARWVNGTLPKISEIKTEKVRMGCPDAGPFPPEPK